MLRVQEICKEKGLAMQDLAKKMGITYQALYATCSGNPTIGKIKEIANALNVHYLELLEEKRDLEFFIKYKGETRRITECDLIEIFERKLEK
jgi:transcriptional regulator with XRE-family HTH domain